jgi:hypothetical protein
MNWVLKPAAYTFTKNELANGSPPAGGGLFFIRVHQMGRDYFGSISGKFWVGVGSSYEIEHLLDISTCSRCQESSPCAACQDTATLCLCENVKYTVRPHHRKALEQALAKIRMQLPENVRAMYDAYHGSWQNAMDMPLDTDPDPLARYQFGKQVLWSLQTQVCHLECET